MHSLIFLMYGGVISVLFSLWRCDYSFVFSLFAQISLMFCVLRLLPGPEPTADKKQQTVGRPNFIGKAKNNKNTHNGNKKLSLMCRLFDPLGRKTWESWWSRNTKPSDTDILGAATYKAPRLRVAALVWQPQVKAEKQDQPRLLEREQSTRQSPNHWHCLYHIFVGLAFVMSSKSNPAVEWIVVAAS